MTDLLTEEEIDFTAGAGAGSAEEFQKREKAARDAARKNTAFFSLRQDQESAILRFLIEANPQPLDPNNPNGPTDPNTGWISTKQHDFVATKPAPRDKPEGVDWPEKVGAICRRTPVGLDKHPYQSDCFICSNIKNDRGQLHRARYTMWTVACLREEVVGTQELVDEGRIDASQIGKRVILDQMDLVEELDDNNNPTGRKIWKKRIVIVNQPVYGFFSPLTTMATYYGTILDRDYKITRKGEKGATKVEYVAFALDPYQVSVERNGSPTVITYDLREPEIRALYEGHGPTQADLNKMINRRVSKKYYDRYFDPRVEVAWKEGGDDSPSGSAPAAPVPNAQAQAGQSATQEPTSGPTASALAEMRARVMGDAAAPAAPAPSQVPPAPSA